MKRLIINSLLLLLAMPAITQTPSTKEAGEWWKETVFYQIYMPSYQDSDGNGLSDFTGMTSRLNHLDRLGVKGIWLTPFLKSPKVDNGYDVADYYDIDPLYGDSDDFKTFLQEAHNRNIKVIIDMVVNHTSTESMWFQESRKSIDNPYRDYYIWVDEPNNWDSFFGGTAWEYDTLTNQYYYHKFDRRMADLNWSNPAVLTEIQNALRYWLELGVDGFRLDVINFLTTDGITQDNPVTEGKQEHRFDIDQAGVIQELISIKSTINEYEDRFVVGEIGSDKLDLLIKYQAPEMMDVVFNFNFGSIPEFSAERIFTELQNMEQKMPGYPTLFFGSHDMPRLMDRLAAGNNKRAAALAALMLTAKGVPFVYYGEEIAMQNISAATVEEIADIQGKTQYLLALKNGKNSQEALAEGNKHNRDKSRSPMQWDDTPYAGFSTGSPWIKSHDNYKNVNVKKATQTKNSILSTYITLIAIRNESKVLQYGTYENLEYTEGLITYTRKHNDERVTVFVNFGEEKKVKIPRGAKILAGKPRLKTDGFLIYQHPGKADNVIQESGNHTSE